MGDLTPNNNKLQPYLELCRPFSRYWKQRHQLEAYICVIVTRVECFRPPDGAQRSIAFFWSYWPMKTSHWLIQSQFVNKKQRISVSIEIFEMNHTRDRAPLGSFQHKLKHRLFLSLMFVAFNKFPLLRLHEASNALRRVFWSGKFVFNPLKPAFN